MEESTATTAVVAQPRTVVIERRCQAPNPHGLAAVRAGSVTPERGAGVYAGAAPLIASNAVAVSWSRPTVRRRDARGP